MTDVPNMQDRFPDAGMPNPLRPEPLAYAPITREEPRSVEATDNDPPEFTRPAAPHGAYLTHLAVPQPLAAEASLGGDAAPASYGSGEQGTKDGSAADTPPAGPSGTLQPPPPPPPPVPGGEVGPPDENDGGNGDVPADRPTPEVPAPVLEPGQAFHFRQRTRWDDPGEGDRFEGPDRAHLDSTRPDLLALDTGMAVVTRGGPVDASPVIAPFTHGHVVTLYAPTQEAAAVTIDGREYGDTGYLGDVLDAVPAFSHPDTRVSIMDLAQNLTHNPGQSAEVSNGIADLLRSRGLTVNETDFTTDHMPWSKALELDTFNGNTVLNEPPAIPETPEPGRHSGLYAVANSVTEDLLSGYRGRSEQAMRNVARIEERFNYALAGPNPPQGAQEEVALLDRIIPRSLAGMEDLTLLLRTGSPVLQRFDGEAVKGLMAARLDETIAFNQAELESPRSADDAEETVRWLERRGMEWEAARRLLDRITEFNQGE